MTGKTLASIAVAATLGAAAGGANASLVFLGQADLQGTGIGAVNTILTIQSPANTTTETGSVGIGAGGAQTTSGNVLTGTSQTQARTISSLGVTSASNLRLVFNPQEPGNTADNSITLSNLVLNIYSPTGQTLFTSGAFTPRTFNATFTGVGNAGQVYGLDAQQAAQAQAAFTGTNYIGLNATATNATGGPETFFVVNSSALPPLAGPIPEPGTLALLASGLLFGGVARKRVGRKEA